jgi:hypothetical protein
VKTPEQNTKAHEGTPRLIRFKIAQYTHAYRLVGNVPQSLHQLSIYDVHRYKSLAIYNC